MKTVYFGLALVAIPLFYLIIELAIKYGIAQAFAGLWG